jgi:hypothetical protein
VTVVRDTGPLIALAKVGQLSGMARLFTEVLIPPGVHRELFAKSGPEVEHLEAALEHFMHVTPLDPMPPEVIIVTRRLDPGEQQAIALAYTRHALLIIDDRQGRVAARRLNMPVTGLVGVLVQAKRRGLCSEVLPLLQDVRQRGYWLSDGLLDVAARLAGEAEEG